MYHARQSGIEKYVPFICIGLSKCKWGLLHFVKAKYSYVQYLYVIAWPAIGKITSYRLQLIHFEDYVYNHPTFIQIMKLYWYAMIIAITAAIDLNIHLVSGYQINVQKYISGHVCALC